MIRSPNRRPASSRNAASTAARVPTTAHATPGLQHGLQRRQVAQPAARLDRHRAHGLDDLGDERGLAGRAGEGAVEVDHVQALGAGVDPALGHADRVVGEDGLGVGAPLPQPHAAASAQVDGRDHDHRLSFTIAAKFSSSRIPAF